MIKKVYINDSIAEGLYNNAPVEIIPGIANDVKFSISSKNETNYLNVSQMYDCRLKEGLKYNRGH